VSRKYDIATALELP